MKVLGCAKNEGVHISVAARVISEMIWKEELTFVQFQMPTSNKKMVKN